MEKLNKKHEQLMLALTTLQDAISLLEDFEKQTDSAEYCNSAFFKSPQQFRRTLRDSVIQRFEYCADSFWKFFKDYLEDQSIILDIKSPKATMRALCQARILNEQQTELAITMFESRNTTSHAYKEEVAELVWESTPQFYKFMMEIMDRINIKQEKKS